MIPPVSASFLSPGFILFLLSFASYPPASAQAVSTPSPQTTYLYFHRTSEHVKLSTPEVFQQVVSEIQGFASANGVAARPEGNAASWEAELPLSAVLDMAHHSGAAYLLYVVVDRPITKWLKVTVQCYDTAGHRIWQEDAAEGGLSGGKGERATLHKLRERLDRRLGQPGLLQAAHGQQPTPTAISSEQTSAPTASASEPKTALTASETQPASGGEREDSTATIRLANGTPVHLLLAESISSKTAQPGSTVKLQVLGDVKVGDLIVIANRAPGFATIESAKSAGRAWRAGNLLLKLGTVTLLNQRQQPLRAWNAVKGKDTGAPMEWTNAVMQTYGLALFFLPFSPLQHGNQAVMPRGTVLEAAIDSDVLLPRAVIEADQPKPAEPHHGTTSVTFYYPNFEDGAAVNVWCGEVKVAHLKRGGKFTLSLPPGKYWLRTWNSKKSPTTALDVEDGGEEYVRVIMPTERTGFGGDVEHLALVPHDVGEAQSAETTQAKSHEVVDIAKLDLTQLHSDPQVKRRK